MKKLIMAFMLLATIKATSQKIDTCIKTCQASRINAVYYTSGIPAKTDTLSFLGVFNYTDDLKGNCIANWVLISKSKVNILFDSYTLTKEEYDNWDGTAIGLLTILGNYLKVTFK